MAPIPIKHRKAVLYQYPKHKLTRAQLSQVRKLIVTKQEPKRFSASAGINMLDSTHYVLNPLYNIGESVAGTGRIAQQFNLQNVDINFTIFLNANVYNVDVFAYAFWSDQATATTISTFTAVTTPNVLSTLPFLGSIVSNQSSLLQFDKFRCTPIKQKHFALNNTGPIAAGQNERQTWSFKLNFYDKKIQFLNDNASYLEGKNLYIGLVASGNGTVDSTAIGAVYHNTMVTFRE